MLAGTTSFFFLRASGRFFFRGIARGVFAVIRGIKARTFKNDACPASDKAPEFLMASRANLEGLICHLL